MSESNDLLQPQLISDKNHLDQDLANAIFQHYPLYQGITSLFFADLLRFLLTRSRKPHEPCWNPNDRFCLSFY
jgi:hypothetical protein